MPGITRADEPTSPTINSSTYPPKPSEKRSISFPIGKNESANAKRSGIANAITFVTLSLPLSLSVTEGSPPSASPTKIHTVGIGYASSAQRSGKRSASTPHIIPSAIGSRVSKLFLNVLNISAIAPISLSYIPSIAAIEPPENPGIINATPIAMPRTTSRRKDFTPLFDPSIYIYSFFFCTIRICSLKEKCLFCYKMF